MTDVTRGFDENDILILESNSAKGITSSTMDDGTSISFASLAEMRTHIAWMRKELGLDSTDAVGFATIQPRNNTDSYS